MKVEGYGGCGLPAGNGCGSGNRPHYRYLQVADQVEDFLQDLKYFFLVLNISIYVQRLNATFILLLRYHHLVSFLSIHQQQQTNTYKKPQNK